MMDLFKRYCLLIKRMRTARRLGFAFVGTTYSMMPHELRLFKKTIPLSYPNDHALLNDVINILLDDEYGLRSISSPVETVVDIGANIGLFSLWARHHFPGARIHAYEPNGEVCNYAIANLMDAKVTLFSEGVSDENGVGILVRATSSRLGKIKKMPAGEVMLTGIETVIERIGGKLDLLKLDCEGAEWEIFLKNSAFRTIRQIRMEYHFDGIGHDMTSLEAFALECGFRIIRVIPRGEYFGIAWLQNSKAEWLT